MEAIDRLCDAHNLAHVTRDGVVVVTAEDKVDPHKAYAGPFRLTASQVSRNNAAPLAGRPRRQPFDRTPDQIQVSFGIESELKAPMVRVGPVGIRMAIDDRGVAISPDADSTVDRPGDDLPPAVTYGFFPRTASGGPPVGQPGHADGRGARRGADGCARGGCGRSRHTQEWAAN